MLDGVKHILLTEHLDMTDSPTEPDLDDQVQALDRGIGRLKETTRSIGGRCSTPPPASFGLTEPVPLGACAILVTEDFLDVPLRMHQLWLDSVYVAIAAPGTSDSSVLILHVNGLMWITNSVFEGAGYNCRAIDVATADGGHPEMFVQGTTIAGFTRDLAPGIVVRPNASLALVGVSFRNLALLKGVRDLPQLGTAVAAYEGAGVLMQDVSFEGHLIHHKPADGREVGLAAGPPAAVAFSVPLRPVWRWPAGPLEETQDISRNELFAAGFLDDRGPLEGIQAERQLLMKQHLGPLAPLQASAPPPAKAPGPAVGAAPRPDVPLDPGPLPVPTAAPADTAPLAVPPAALPSEQLMPENDFAVSGDSEAPAGGAAAAVDNVQARTVIDDTAGARFALVIACAVAAGVAAGLCAVAAVLAMQRRRRDSLAQQSLDTTLKPEPAVEMQEPQVAFGSWP